jgi:hypothetical protein
MDEPEVLQGVVDPALEGQSVCSVAVAESLLHLAEEAPRAWESE